LAAIGRGAGVSVCRGGAGFPEPPIRLGERTIHIGASIGIASGTLIECTSSELFRRADIAMYHAKMTGKGRVTHYDAELNSARERSWRLKIRSVAVWSAMSLRSGISRLLMRAARK
jgi:hypothetical protein